MATAVVKSPVEYIDAVSAEMEAIYNGGNTATAKLRYHQRDKINKHHEKTDAQVAAHLVTLANSIKAGLTYLGWNEQPIRQQWVGPARLETGLDSLIRALENIAQVYITPE